MVVKNRETNKTVVATSSEDGFYNTPFPQNGDFIRDCIRYYNSPCFRVVVTNVSKTGQIEWEIIPTDYDWFLANERVIYLFLVKYLDDYKNSEKSIKDYLEEVFLPKEGLLVIESFVNTVDCFLNKLRELRIVIDDNINPLFL